MSVSFDMDSNKLVHERPGDRLIKICTCDASKAANGTERLRFLCFSHLASGCLDVVHLRRSSFHDNVNVIVIIISNSSTLNYVDGPESDVTWS